jgi:ribose/xylose/arabinose/galactoside ABC-type transport system permease subunit
MTERAGGSIDPFNASEEYLSDVLETEPIVEARSSLQVFMQRLLTNRELAILLVTIAVFVLFWAINDRFVSQNNLVGIIRRMPTIGVVAVGMTFLLVAGEIDLSVGTSAGFCATIIAIAFDRWKIDPWIGLLIILGLGLLIGTINGLLVTRVKLPAFIATLGMLAVLRGTANALSGGLAYDAKKATEHSFFQLLGGNIILPGNVPNRPILIPNQFVIMLIVVIIGGLILAKTRFGSDVYSTGGDAEAARNNGVNTGRVKLICFMLTGALCGLTGALMYSRTATAPVSAGAGLELQVIAAIIIGGVGLFGGRGTIFGSLIGVTFLSMLPAGLIMIGVQDFWEGVVLGIVILGAAGLDLIVRRVAARVLGRTAK